MMSRRVKMCPRDGCQKAIVFNETLFHEPILKVYARIIPAGFRLPLKQNPRSGPERMEHVLPKAGHDCFAFACSLPQYLQSVTLDMLDLTGAFLD